MDISRFKYYVNVSYFLEVTALSVDTGRCYGDPLNAYVEFPPEDHGADQETLANMLVNDDTLFIIQGYKELFNLKSVCREEDYPYWIRLESIGNSIKDSVGLKEITSWIEYDALHENPVGNKIATERNYDGSVTFSVPTLQGVTLKQRVLPALSHTDNPGDRGEQGSVDDVLVLTDKVDVLRENQKELISKLQPGMLTYTDVADAGSKDGNVFRLCRCGRGNGKPIFDPSNPEHRSIIMSQALREMMMPIEDKYPQLHRARLNKPKSI